MKIRLSTVLDSPPQVFIEHLQSTKSFRYITWPMLTFQPQNGAWSERWIEGSRDEFRLRLLGILPMCSQRINISNPSQGIAADGSMVLRDNGEGSLMQTWDHWIFVKPIDAQQTHYTDEVEVRARYLAPVLTPLFAAFALVFYTYRQWRWKRYLLR